MTDHQELAREHLGVDPGTRLDDQQDAIEAFRDDRLDRITARDTLPNSLPDGPVIAIHVIPNGVFSTTYVKHPDDLPPPPLFGHSQPAGFPTSLGDGVIAYNSRLRQEHPDYVYLAGVGLGDGVLHVRSSEPGVLAVEVPGLVEFTQHAPDVPARDVDSVGDGGVVVALTVEPGPNPLVAPEVAGVQINGVEDIPLNIADELSREDRVVQAAGRDVRPRCGS